MFIEAIVVSVDGINGSTLQAGLGLALIMLAFHDFLNMVVDDLAYLTLAHPATDATVIHDTGEARRVPHLGIGVFRGGVIGQVREGILDITGRAKLVLAGLRIGEQTAFGTCTGLVLGFREGGGIAVQEHNLTAPALIKVLAGLPIGNEFFVSALPKTHSFNVMSHNKSPWVQVDDVSEALSLTVGIYDNPGAVSDGRDLS